MISGVKASMFAVTVALTGVTYGVFYGRPWALVLNGLSLTYWTHDLKKELGRA